MCATLVICGATVFTSCSSDDNDNNIDNLSEKILGKWEAAERDGEPITTNKKTIFTFVSATKAYVSASRNSHPEMNPSWMDKLEADVVIIGDKITLTFHPDEHKTSVHEFSITSINGSEFSAIERVTVRVDGNVILSSEQTVRFEKTTADYAEPVLGLWECEGLIGDETYNDGNDRLEFLSDGTYRYYRKNDAGQWQAVTTRDFQDYFVDGTLLATRWKNQGEDELREWWEIESISGDEMVWTALRQNPDGSTFQQKMTWKKIDLNVAEKILGKWMYADTDGQPTLTNKKAIYTFVSDTKALMSASLNSHPEAGTQWIDQLEADVVISGNKMTLVNHPDKQTTMVEEFIITDINDSEFNANRKITITADGAVVISVEQVVRFTKVTADFSADIIGTWEGHCTSEGSEFDDGQEHRWQYNADGTYVYYVKDGNNWVPYATNTLNEYFVDGNLLCTRWIDQGQENREWWEITIADGKINWTALRQKEDGSTFTATFEMKKVQ